MKRNQVIPAQSSEHDFKVAYDALPPSEREAYGKQSEDIALATAFIMGGRPEIYGDLLIDI